MNWFDAFDSLGHYLFLALKLLVGLLIIVTNMNLTGKTKLSQMNAIDLVGNFILGGVVGGIIYNGDISFVTYIVCLLIGIGLIDLFNYLIAKTNFFRAFAVGSPITLIADSKFCVDVINNKRNKIDLPIIASLLRSSGHFSFSNVDFLQIEPGGQLTIVEKENARPRPASIILMNGVIFSELLKNLHRSDDWLRQHLQQAGLSELQEIFLVEWWNDRLTIVMCDGTIRTQTAI
ncbi:DUF421 domain-containing protein [Bordetella avium]|uniref:Membrane protein n=1 Tax=Bordetella avium (strain 197N) TaxID=360910 RepID=Q2L1P1_BORA1|nr:YetF domain-containing protein [Bordetella avium]CAJ49214.1 putative membrane protein [Bordetella avium 197N]